MSYTFLVAGMELLPPKFRLNDHYASAPNMTKSLKMKRDNNISVDRYYVHNSV